MRKTKKHNKEKTMRIIILCLFAMAVILPLPAQQPFQVTPATTYGAAEKKDKTTGCFRVLVGQPEATTAAL